ncbi:MAG: hypothetical protein GC159_06675 [Phycisphaera sp.]|nr:hypothetical protein [Phycisphaera sp.]
MAGHKPRKDREAVTFYTYPKLLFTWPLIVAGPLLYFLPQIPLIGWTYLLIMLAVIMTISVDVERNYAFVWVVIAGLLFFAGRWLSDAYDIMVFKAMYDFFDGLNAHYDRGFGMALSILLAIPFAIMMVWVRINHRWRISHNEFEHYAFGRADDSLARGAKRVRTTYPDLLEFLMCGAGTLIVYSATGRQELRRIPHVPLLFLVRRRINRLLEFTAVTTETEKDSIIEEELDDEEDGGSTHEEELGGEEASSGDESDPL